MNRLRKLLVYAGLASSLTLIASAQGTAFTYQGRLADGVNPANGIYDLRFKLYTDPLGNNQTGSSVISNAVPVSNGLFLVALDFGPVFNGSNYWLEVDVKTNNGGAYANLSPLQALTPAPYAVFAASAGGVNGPLASGSLSGTYGNILNLNNAGNLFSGSFTGNGSALSNLNVSTLGGLSVGQFWQTSGNSNTVAGANFLGTKDNQPLELKVNNQRALRLEPNTNGAPNIIAGSPFNTVALSNSAATISGGLSNNIGSNALAATISGGATNTIRSNALYATVGGGTLNTAAGNYATVNGGYQNFASGNFAGGDSATVGGGFQNGAVGNNAVVSGGTANFAQGDNTAIGGGWYNTNRGPQSTIGGGQVNLIQTNVYFSTIGGGAYNSIGTNSASSAISGGYNNQIAAYTTDVAIGGGSYNSAGSNTYYAVIAGGRNNTIADNALAAVIGGGYANYAYGTYSVVPGGYFNIASGSNSFAAGTHSYAGNDGTFVWSDSSPLTPAAFTSTAPNEFLIRAAGGVGINTNNPAGAAMQVAGAVKATSFQGDGSGVTSINAGNISSGTLPAARLPGTAALLNASQTFSGGFNTFGDIGLENSSATYHHLELSGGNSLGYLYGSYLRWSDGVHLSYNYYADSAGGDHIPNSGGATSRVTVGYGFVGIYVGGVNSAPGTPQFYADTTHVEVRGTFNNNSDRNAKQDFAPVSSAQMLENVLRLPLSEWSYKDDPTTRHVGPMAQDFSSVFNIGTDEKHIAPIDEGGVALAAIQGLNQKLETQNQKLEAENEELKARLDAVERMLGQKANR